MSFKASHRRITPASHLVNVNLNGTYVGQVQFNDQTEGIMGVSLPQSALKEGQNVVTLISHRGPGGVSLVDSIRLTYRHTFHADQDALRFTAPGARRLRVEGFSNADIGVIDVTESFWQSTVHYILSVYSNQAIRGTIRSTRWDASKGGREELRTQLIPSEEMPIIGRLEGVAQSTCSGINLSAGVLERRMQCQLVTVFWGC